MTKQHIHFELRDLYEEHIDYLNDSHEHKRYMLESDRCFVEWVEEFHPERIDEAVSVTEEENK